MKNNSKIKVQFSPEKSFMELNHKFANLIFIDIFLNENKITVMFDTGASVTVLNESVVHMLKAEITDSTVKAGGSAGKVGDYRTAIVKNINIGNNVIEEHEVMIVPDKALELGLDDDGNLFPAKGVLGWDIISLFKWTVNDNEKIITIEQSQPKNTLQNLLWENFPIINAVYNDKPIKFGFDSGHTESFLGEGMIDLLDGLYTTIDTTKGMDGVLQEEVNVIAKFAFYIQNVQFILNEVVVLKRNVFGQASEDMMGLLGADIVCGRAWELDYPNKSFNIL